MKNLKKIFGSKLAVGLGVVGLMLSSVAAHADTSLEGSFRGKDKADSNSRFDLVMRPLTAEGRDGSYLGIMVQNSPLKIGIYLIDPISDNQYMMEPREVTGDGEVIGTRENPDPSLVLNVTGERHGRTAFNITNANSSNHVGFQGPYDFENGDSSDLEWLDMKPGVFTLGGDHISIGSAMTDHETAISCTLPGTLNGEFILREKMPAVYTLTNVSVTAVGDLLARDPTKLIVFLRKPSLFGFKNDFFAMIDPSEGRFGDVIKVDRAIFQ
jgi:hypothetical protein